MASLTPESRREEITGDAMKEGYINGTMVLLPSFAGLYAAMQNAKFVKFTNWQSRTAITIMPALFVFALTSEHKLSHRMSEVAGETEHAMKSVEWAEKYHRKANDADEKHLRTLYRQSVLGSGVQLIENPELEMYHKTANYIQQNPFKCIGGIAIPAVASIFYGKSTNQHLSFSIKLLHTRVIGQFAVICTLLGVMGLKEAMDRSGRFITEAQVEERIHEMISTRTTMLDRLDYEASQRPSYMKNKLAKHA